MGDGV